VDAFSQQMRELRTGEVNERQLSKRGKRDETRREYDEATT
jgi:hypothetical protein